MMVMRRRRRKDTKVVDASVNFSSKDDAKNAPANDDASAKKTNEKNNNNEKRKQKEEDTKFDDKPDAVVESRWRSFLPLFVLYGLMVFGWFAAYSRYGSAIFIGHRRLHLTLTEWREKLGKMQTTAVLIGGPHRGGTSIAWSCVSAHEKIGAFASRKVSDHAEGIFVQDVYPKFGVGEEYQAMRTGRDFSRNGLGRYALNEAHHLTERSALNTDENGVKLMNSFGQYWGFKDKGDEKEESDIAFVVEKSPPNAIIGTFLRALYKRVGMKTTKHVYVTRHPIANAMALNAMKELNGRVTIVELLDNYVKLHETAQRDAKALGKDALYPLRMEDFIREPERKAEEIFSFIFDEEAEAEAEVMAEKEEEKGKEEPKRRAFDLCVAKIEADTGKPLSRTDPNEKYRKKWCKMLEEEESARALSTSLAEKYQGKLDALGLEYDIATWCDDDDKYR